MGKISNLCKFRKDDADTAQLNLNYVINNSTPDHFSCCYMSRSECLFIFVRYLLTLVVVIFLMTILFPELVNEVLAVSISSFTSVLSLVLLLPCSYRLANQKLSPYLLLFHLLPFDFYFLYGAHDLFLLSSFLLYLALINIYDIKPPACERRKELASVLPDEYPFGLALICFCLLYLSFFLIFELDDAVILLMILSWILFLLAKWHWPVVVLNIVGAVGVFWFFSSGFVEVKHHQNIIINALVKVSLLDNILFLIFSLSLFINMLFWLETWQRERQPIAKSE
ncbi:TPA: hypothetical protein ACPZRY_003462 [Yersinia enterocolitica]|uniref:hypothetical protein n=1 Tax=Yersinia enterocolitica TaxID=630 RepID=UPI0033044A73|nr:hypothetical protein [Yersinia enterocolitica]EKN4807146.1 hypothetical protein [Yersinia enterocolitica]HDL7328814.1 hypothetical protein [Yersinia enterocolitica]HDL7354133.1 hypothetical protein [Yersinia enterocolitica]HDL7958224.1 hypothetical protein [Yersinia enterocolitica]